MQTECSKCITVIVPIYNAEKYLHQCIDSIVNQTYKNLEIILVDDGSQDSSGQICDAYAKEDTRIRVLHKENGGQATARNTALKIATGEYIGFVDADDWIAPNMYELMLSNIQNTSADIVTCGRYVVDERNGKAVEVFCGTEPILISDEEAIKRFLLWDGIDSSSCDKLFRRKILEGVFYPAGYVCEDVPFVYAALKNSHRVCLIGKPLYYYRQVVGSTSHSSYSERTMGLVIYPKRIKEDIHEAYKRLEEEAGFYYLQSLFYFLEIFYLANPNDIPPVEYKLRDYDNAYIDYRTKLKIVLMKLKLFVPIKKMLRRIKHT